MSELAPSTTVDNADGPAQDPEPRPPTLALALVQDVVARIAAPTRAETPTATELLTALTALRALQAEIAEWEPRLVTAAREAGTSWASLADALGLASRQAAERRYLRLRPSPGGERTGEGRVEAERSVRAANRATNQWAKRNSATLRQLAGQVSSLEGLSPGGERLVERVRNALGNDNAAELLSPLAEAHAYLHAHDNAALADRISQVTTNVERVRAEAHRARRSDTGDGKSERPRVP